VEECGAVGSVVCANADLGREIGAARRRDAAA